MVMRKKYTQILAVFPGYSFPGYGFVHVHNAQHLNNRKHKSFLLLLWRYCLFSFYSRLVLKWHINFLGLVMLVV